MPFRRFLVLGVLVASAAVPGVARASDPAPALSGKLAITPGACDGTPSGSYFRMILKTGNADGPFVSNNDSGCGDKTFTLLKPGDDGGLVLGTYQSEPSPAFKDGNSLAARITEPTPFFTYQFSTSTNATDPQTQTAVSPPALSVAGDGTLSGDLRSFAASWNNQEFNQGSPKPDGSTPGLTKPPSGTLDSQSGAYTLEWTSQIVGGPFDGFTGLWHLEGTFTPDTTPTTAAAVSSGNDASSGDSDQPAPSQSGASGNSTTTSSLGLPSSTTASTATRQAASPSTAKSPSVVIARSGGGSSGKGWVAIPAGLAVIAVGGLAIRFRMLKRREAAP